MSFIAIIPARLASTRLPNKPLLDIGGKPMVVRTAEQALKSGASRVVVATDAEEIALVTRSAGLETVLTNPEHPTGTDRLSEVVRILDVAPEQIIVNVQGDEPLINPSLIDQVAQTLAQTSSASIATLGVPITEAETLFNANTVKIVVDHADHALYFSRAPIPWARNALADGVQRLADGLPALQHIGLYAYRTSFLQVFPTLPQGTLERIELLEQLRALEHGYRIVVSRSAHPPAPGIDTAEDLEKVRNIVRNSL